MKLLTNFCKLKIQNIAEEKKWKVLSKTASKNDTNKYWSGEYFIDTTGGNVGEKQGCIQLANMLYDYVSENQIKLIQLYLIRTMLRCENPELLLKDPTQLDIMKTEYNVSDELLICKISGKKISSKDFLKNDTIQLCHLISKKRFITKIETNKLIENTIRNREKAASRNF